MLFLALRKGGVLGSRKGKRIARTEPPPTLPFEGKKKKKKRGRALS